MMGKVALYLPLACLLLLSASLARAEDSSETGGNYTSTVEQKEDEDDIKVYDNKGNLVTTIFFFLADGLEIEKPEDREVCLVKETKDNGTCFEEKPTTNKLPDGIWEKCDGREVLFLKPADCDQDPETDGTGSEVSDGDRRKRSTTTRCCLWTKTTSSYCGATHCCKTNLWGRCRGYCCTYYNTRTTWSYSCRTGYTRRG